MSTPDIAVIMGSVSDSDIAAKATKVLDTYGVSYELGVKSAHRTPKEMLQYAEGLAERGVKVVIALAGGSAHLPGMVASSTSIPVLAVPVKREHHGDEAMKSSTALPPGIPVAVMPNNGADRAALMAVRILALSDSELAVKYLASQEEMRASVVAQDEAMRKDGI